MILVQCPKCRARRPQRMAECPVCHDLAGASLRADLLEIHENQQLQQALEQALQRGVPKTVPSQFTKPCGLFERTLSQSTRMNTKGQAARIQPIVPPILTSPNSFLASFMCVNAIEFVIEIVGT